MIKEWKYKSSRTLLETPIFNVLSKNYINPENLEEFRAYVLDLPNWVNIIGLNDDGDILLIKQFRFGTDKIELEIPGGIVEPNESLEDAARRELKEETGYTVNSIKKIGSVAANPAIMVNNVHTFLAALGEKQAVNFDPHEIIEQEFFSPSEVKGFLKDNKIQNAYVVNAFMWYSLFNENF